MLFNNDQIRKILCSLLKEYQICPHGNLYLYLGVSPTDNNHCALYNWVDRMIEKNPDMTYGDIKSKLLDVLESIAT